MLLIHGKQEKIKVCKCPACQEDFKPGKKIFFPREQWHPFRTYDFFNGQMCTNCGMLLTKQEIEKYGK